MTQYLLAIDQGTTSSRAMVFSDRAQALGSYQLEFTQHYPHDGWVEHDPEEIWQTVVTCCHMALEKAQIKATAIAALGISNQRETTIIWHRKTGKPIYPAIVWQDRRTADCCHQLLQQEKIATLIQHKTGLLLDAYFSASKIVWLLDNVAGAREQAEKGELAFGTVDTFLLWRLTQTNRHATDVTNAARTLLFNIHTQQWDDELLALFNIPRSLLPEVLDNCAEFGTCAKEILGHAIPVTAMMGDQQAAAVGQVCLEPGMIKSTYGTGCFVFLNTGKTIVQSSQKLLATVAYRIAGNIAYGLEGSIFNAGTTVKWLRDKAHVIHEAAQTETFAESVADNGGVYFVPAFTGLGAPYWDAYARGAILGLTRDSEMAHIVRAALEAVCYQTRDLLLAMQQDYRGELNTLRVDGGMVVNDWLMQFLTDMLQLPVERPLCIETSALGVALLAGLGAGIYKNFAELKTLWQFERRFTTQMDVAMSLNLYAGWQRAVGRVL